MLLSVYVSVCESECLIDALSNRECCCRQLHVLIMSYRLMYVVMFDVWFVSLGAGSGTQKVPVLDLDETCHTGRHFPCCYKWLTFGPILPVQEAAKKFSKDNISRSTKFSRKTYRGQDNHVGLTLQTCEIFEPKFFHINNLHTHHSACSK